MMIWGRVIGVLVGSILYGQFGAVIGLIVGHIFDKGLKISMNASSHSVAARSVFFKTVFQVMGHVAKSKGAISEEEIRVARDIMLNDFKLNAAQMALAIQYFTEGKQPAFDLDVALNNFKSTCGSYADLRAFFLELQLKAVMANKNLDSALKYKLIFICDRLGIPLSELEYQLHAHGYNDQQERNQYKGFYENKKHKYSHTHHADTTPDPLSAAYKLLGVSADADIKTIKSAYRRLISKNHPDKLFAKGLPPEMMTVAKEKTQQITVAYDLIMRSRE